MKFHGVQSGVTLTHGKLHTVSHTTVYYPTNISDMVRPVGLSFERVMD